VPLSSKDVTKMFEETCVEFHFACWCEYEADGFFIVDFLVFRNRFFTCSTLREDKI
jgi:hypothetical protein